MAAPDNSAFVLDSRGRIRAAVVEDAAERDKGAPNFWFRDAGSASRSPEYDEEDVMSRMRRGRASEERLRDDVVGE